MKSLQVRRYCKKLFVKVTLKANNVVSETVIKMVVPFPGDQVAPMSNFNEKWQDSIVDSDSLTGVVILQVILSPDSYV